MKNNDEQRHIVAYLDGLDLTPVPSTLSGTRPKGDGCLLAKVNAVRGVQSTGGEELRRRRMLMPSILDKAFKGEL